MNRKWRITACILSAAVLLCACADKKPNTDFKKNEPTKEEREKQSKLDVIKPLAYGNVDGLRLEPGTYISIIGKGEGTAYWNQVKAGAKQAEADLNKMLGYKGEDKIKVNYSGPSKTDDVDEQVNILDEELARYPAAVGIAIVDANACEVQFDLATENEIPIVAFDSGSDYQGIQAMCATNNEEAAKTAAAKLSAIIEEQGEIIVIAHDSKSTTGMIREEAFLDEIKKNYKDVKNVEVYHIDELEKMAKTIAEERNAAKAEGEEVVNAADVTQEEVVQYLIEKHPNLKGIYATNVDAAQLVVKTCEKMEREDLAVVAFDGGKKQLKALEEGKINGLLLQNPYGMGYATVVAASRSVLGMGNQAEVDTSYTWVTKDNMDKTAIQNMLY